MARRHELRHDLTTIGDDDALPAPHVPNVFTETVFQFAQAYGLHPINVASWSYIVNGEWGRLVRSSLTRGLEDPWPVDICSGFLP